MAMFLSAPRRILSSPVDPREDASVVKGLVRSRYARFLATQGETLVSFLLPNLNPPPLRCISVTASTKIAGFLSWLLHGAEKVLEVGLNKL
jgi:hypothetical protein